MAAQISPQRLVEPARAKEYEAILDAYNQAGGDPAWLKMPDVAVLVVSANRVLASSEVPGVHFEVEELAHGVRAHITVAPEAHLDNPVHLCFGMLEAEGVQQIIADYDIGSHANVEFIANCTFPNAVKLRHQMDARIRVGTGATVMYRESHFHGPHGGIEVDPRAKVVVDEGGRFVSSFNLTRGRVGRLKLDYEVAVEANGLAELSAKAYGSADDHLQVHGHLYLDGESARGLTRTFIAVRDQAVSEVLTTTDGNAPFARGHMECTQIVRGRALARNIPVVVVRDDRAHVTHEAAIGSVNHRELETLMARGLDEDAAVDVIIRGMLQEG